MTYRVLVTDDEPEKVEDIEKGLKELGYEVLSARNGKQAIEILQKEHIDLMVLDLVMPEGGGVSVIEAVRANEKLHELMIFIFSSHPGVLDKIAHMEVDIVFLKSEDPKLIVQEIDSRFKSSDGKPLKRKRMYYDTASSIESRMLILKQYIDYEKNRKLEALIVDDDDTIRESIADILEKEGFNLWVAKSGEHAWEILNKTDRASIDIALVDLNMPGMNGDELIRKMRLSNNFEINEIPILVMTALGAEDWAKGEESLQHKAIQEWAYIKISKDDALDKEKLIKAIERLIRKYVTWHTNNKFEILEPNDREDNILK